MDSETRMRRLSLDEILTDDAQKALDDWNNKRYGGQGPARPPGAPFFHRPPKPRVL